MATSRWMWPSPIGLDRNRTRRRRVRAGGLAVGRSVAGGMVCEATGWSRTKSRISRFTFTASRPGRPCPPPSKVTKRAPGMVSAISTPTL